MAILTSLQNNPFNIIKGFVGDYIYACRVSKYFFPIFNNNGIANSYNTIRKTFNSHVKQRRIFLNTLDQQNIAIQLSFYNLVCYLSTKHNRLYSTQSIMMVVTAFVAVPPANVAILTFRQQQHINYTAVQQLNPRHILPSMSDFEALKRFSIICCQIHLLDSLKLIIFQILCMYSFTCLKYLSIGSKVKCDASSIANL